MTKFVCTITEKNHDAACKVLSNAGFGDYCHRAWGGIMSIVGKDGERIDAFISRSGRINLYA